MSDIKSVITRVRELASKLNEDPCGYYYTPQDLALLHERKHFKDVASEITPLAIKLANECERLQKKIQRLLDDWRNAVEYQDWVDQNERSEVDETKKPCNACSAARPGEIYINFGPDSFWDKCGKCNGKGYLDGEKR